MSILSKGYHHLNLDLPKDEEYIKKYISDLIDSINITKIIFKKYIGKYDYEKDNNDNENNDDEKNELYLYIFTKENSYSIKEEFPVINEEIQNGKKIRIFGWCVFEKNIKIQGFNSVLTKENIVSGESYYYKIIFEKKVIPVKIGEEKINISLFDIANFPDFLVNKIIDKKYKKSDLEFPDEDPFIFKNIIQEYIKGRRTTSEHYIQNLFEDIKSINDLKNILKYFKKINESLKFFGLPDLFSYDFKGTYNYNFINAVSTEYLDLSKAKINVNQKLLKLEFDKCNKDIINCYVILNDKSDLEKKILLNYVIEKYGKENVYEEKFYYSSQGIAYIIKKVINVDYIYKNHDRNFLYEKCKKELDLQMSEDEFTSLLEIIDNEDDIDMLRHINGYDCIIDKINEISKDKWNIKKLIRLFTVLTNNHPSIFMFHYGEADNFDKKNTSSKYYTRDLIVVKNIVI